MNVSDSDNILELKKSLEEAIDQKQRALARNGMTQTKFHDILQRQLPDHEKSRRAEFIVPTGLGKAYTYRALKRLIRDLIEVKG